VTKRKNKIGGQFAPRLVEMLESQAYRALSLSGHRILARIEIEMANHGGNDNGKLPVTFDDFEVYGIHRHAIAPGIRECEALGFVEVTERGCAGNGEFRHPSLYRLTYRHLTRAEHTHEWRRIKTMEEAMTIAQQARKSVQQPRFQKQETSGGKRQVSVAESHTENGKPPVAESTTTGSVRIPPLLSISPGRPGPSPGSMGHHAPASDGDGRHTRKSLMAYVASVIEEQLHDLDRRRVAARRRAKAAIMAGRE
jgi:hypothetical protein